MRALLASALLWTSAICCGLMAGAYFAFAAFIMTSLGPIAPAAGMAAMNAGLEAAGIVTSEKVGRVRICWLEPGGMDPLALWIEARRHPSERKLDRLAAI